MTREEEILTACKGFLKRYLNIEQAGLSIGFLDGAVWADEHPINVWHDASEEPQGDEWHIAYIDVFGSIQSLKCPSVTFDTFPSLADLAAGVGMQCWAYIEDLLPKGGEK